MRLGVLLFSWLSVTCAIACDGPDDGDDEQSGQAGASGSSDPDDSGPTGFGGAPVLRLDDDSVQDVSGDTRARDLAEADCTTLCEKPVVQTCLGDECSSGCLQARDRFVAWYPHCSVQYDALLACAAPQPNDDVQCVEADLFSEACNAERHALLVCAPRTE